MINILTPPVRVHSHVVFVFALKDKANANVRCAGCPESSLTVGALQLENMNYTAGSKLYCKIALDNVW